jgi:hypothetical protein
LDQGDKEVTQMWKTIVLCAALFSGVALTLGVMSQVLDARVLPVAAALSLCLVGMVLILAAPAESSARDTRSEGVEESKVEGGRVRKLLEA